MNDTTTVAVYAFEPPIRDVTEVQVDQYDGDTYDLFDRHGNCLNEGCPFHFLPTKKQVREFVTTGQVRGEIESHEWDEEKA